MESENIAKLLEESCNEENKSVRLKQKRQTKGGTKMRRRKN